jgi:hypothetical protein
MLTASQIVIVFRNLASWKRHGIKCYYSRKCQIYHLYTECIKTTNAMSFGAACSHDLATNVKTDLEAFLDQIPCLSREGA